MALILKEVQAARGPRWVAEAFRVFGRRPLGFAMMFLGAFSLLMLDRVTPHGAWTPVIGAGALAAGLAWVGGFALRLVASAIARRVIPRAVEA